MSGSGLARAARRTVSRTELQTTVSGKGDWIGGGEVLIIVLALLCEIHKENLNQVIEGFIWRR